jgi:hypothetical protein
MLGTNSKPTGTGTTKQCCGSGILTQITVPKLSEKLFGMFIPDPGSSYFPHPGSRIRIRNTAQLIKKNLLTYKLVFEKGKFGMPIIYQQLTMFLLLFCT